MVDVTATGKWTQADVPHKGWSCIDVQDAGEPSRLCEMCETQMVRYVHTMEHPDYEGTLGVGCICAGHMEGDYAAAQQREDRFKRIKDRRKRWLQRSWHKSYSGNEYTNTGDGFNIVVFKHGDFWSGRVEHRQTRRQIFAQRQYRTAEQVKLAAFDAMMKMKRKIVKG
jgi:hypothetical protein